MKPADRGWIAIAAFVLVFNMAAEDGETLSEGADRYMLSHRWLTRGVAGALVCHVCNVVPPKYDFIHWAFLFARRWRLMRRHPS